MKEIIYMVYDQRAEIMDLEDCMCMYMDEDINGATEYAKHNNGILFEAEYEMKNGERTIIKEKRVWFDNPQALVKEFISINPEKKHEEKKFNEVYNNYCCIDLLRAKEAGLVDEVVSGIFFSNGGKCKEDGTPSIKYCPFCGAKIITIKTETGWNWKTNNK